MRVIVTGARGLIGRRCVARLAAAGAEVHGLSRRATSEPTPATCHDVDLLDVDATAATVGRIRATHLLHLAWCTEHGSYWDSASNLDWVTASVALVRAFLAAGGRRIVAAGTSAEYQWTGEPCNEDRTPLAPASLYGASKLAFATLLAVLAARAGASYAWGRIFFAYGPGEPRQKLLSSCIERLARSEPIAIRSPERRLDFVHVDDVAQAFCELVQGDHRGPLNIGTGRALDVASAIAAIAHILHAAPHFERLDATREPDVVADATKIGRALSWQPLSLEEGLISLVQSVPT